VSEKQHELLAKVYRGSLVESMHHGSVVVVNHQGQLVAHTGNPDFKTFARSTVKLIQALPVIESGAADTFQFSEEDLALVCASHNAEVQHTDRASSILQKAGVSEDKLQCGPHYPYHAGTTEEMRERGEKPRSIHNNCSGKHSGMLALAQHLNAPFDTYTELAHPVQQLNLKTLSELSDVPADQIDIGIDGCSVPVFGLSLLGLAKAFARVGNPSGLSEARQKSTRRVLDAIRKHPFYIAGSDRFDTSLIQTTQGRLIGKAGAEAIFAVVIPEKGWGLVAKIADGNNRSLYAVVVETLNQLGLLSESELEALKAFHRPIVKNWKGQEVGHIETTLKLTRP
jgi:L-asparaginase II